MKTPLSIRGLHNFAKSELDNFLHDFLATFSSTLYQVPVFEPVHIKFLNAKSLAI